MMVDLHFKDYFDKGRIDEIKDKHKFRNPLLLEKFIMNYEIFTHIREVLPDCVVKGGMAVPFHLTDNSLRRLSVDIDMVTSSSREDVIKAMKIVSKKLSSVVSIPEEPHTPGNTHNKKLPLLTYYCNYKSSFAEDPEIKIEIFHGNNMNIKTKKITEEIKIFEFLIDFPISIFDHTSLIGDKLTTLPFHTIGLDSKRELDVPKQIYDIANLLKSNTTTLSISEILDAFEIISHEEISYVIENPPSFNDVLEDFVRFPNSLLEIDDHVKLNSSYEGRFTKFTTEMLGKSYPPFMHIIDILLIQSIAHLIVKKFQNKIGTGAISQKILEILAELMRLFTLSMKDKNRIKGPLRAKYRKDSAEEKLIKNMLPEQAFLYDQLIEIKKI